MKRIFVLILSAAMACSSFAQTNTHPHSKAPTAFVPAEIVFKPGDTVILQDMKTQRVDTLLIEAVTPQTVKIANLELPRGVRMKAKDKIFLLIRSGDDVGNFFRHGAGLDVSGFSGVMSGNVMSYTPTNSPKGLFLMCQLYSDVILIRDENAKVVFSLKKG